jgi:hypothetical protein
MLRLFSLPTVKMKPLISPKACCLHTTLDSDLAQTTVKTNHGCGSVGAPRVAANMTLCDKKQRWHFWTQQQLHYQRRGGQRCCWSQVMFRWAVDTNKGPLVVTLLCIKRERNIRAINNWLPSDVTALSWRCAECHPLNTAGRLSRNIRSLAGRRYVWKCSYEVEVSLRPTVSRPVCPGVRRPSGTRDQFFFLLEISFRQLLIYYFVASSLTRGRVCNLLLQFLLGLARAVTLRSQSHRTHGHMLLPHLRLPKLGQSQSQSQSQSHIATDGQSVSMSWCQAQILDIWPEFPPPSKLLFCLFGAPSLTRGRVCHVSVFIIEVYHSLVYLQQYLHLN